MSILKVHLDKRPIVSLHGFARRAIFGPEQTQYPDLCLEFVELQNGEESSPHAHCGSHTMIYTVTGRVRVYHGSSLENSIDVGPGDCVYIPPDIIHYVINTHEVPMTAVVARSPARHVVVEYPELRKLVTRTRED